MVGWRPEPGIPEFEGVGLQTLGFCSCLSAARLRASSFTVVCLGFHIVAVPLPKKENDLVLTRQFWEGCWESLTPYGFPHGAGGPGPSVEAAVRETEAGAGTSWGGGGAFTLHPSPPGGPSAAGAQELSQRGWGGGGSRRTYPGEQIILDPATISLS